MENQQKLQKRGEFATFYPGKSRKISPFCTKIIDFRLHHTNAFKKTLKCAFHMQTPLESCKKEVNLLFGSKLSRKFKRNSPFWTKNRRFLSPPYNRHIFQTGKYVVAQICLIYRENWRKFRNLLSKLKRKVWWLLDFAIFWSILITFDHVRKHILLAPWSNINRRASINLQSKQTTELMQFQ